MVSQNGYLKQWCFGVKTFESFKIFIFIILPSIYPKLRIPYKDIRPK